MKLDMSKVYNRVEWMFLERVMSKLGFCRPWINLVMKCATTVSYAVLINGAPTNNFTPKRPIVSFLISFWWRSFFNFTKAGGKSRKDSWRDSGQKCSVGVSFDFWQTIQFCSLEQQMKSLTMSKR